MVHGLMVYHGPTIHGLIVLDPLRPLSSLFSRPIISRHLGHNPSGASTGIARPHKSQIWVPFILATGASSEQAAKCAARADERPRIIAEDLGLSGTWFITTVSRVDER
jgi:hypothetical protein